MWNTMMMVSLWSLMLVFIGICALALLFLITGMLVVGRSVLRWLKDR